MRSRIGGRSDLRWLLTSSGLEQGFLGSQPEPEARSQKGKGHILTTNQWSVTRASGPSALQKRISTKSKRAARQSIFIGGKGVQYVWIDPRADLKGGPEL